MQTDFIIRFSKLDNADSFVGTKRPQDVHTTSGASTSCANRVMTNNTFLIRNNQHE